MIPRVVLVPGTRNVEDRGSPIAYRECANNSEDILISAPPRVKMDREMRRACCFKPLTWDALGDPQKANSPPQTYPNTSQICTESFFMRFSGHPPSGDSLCVLTHKPTGGQPRMMPLNV